MKPDVVILMGWYALGSRSQVPLIYWGDSTVGQRLNKAPHWQRLSKRTQRAGPRVEAQSLRALAGTMWSSRWAQDDARARYGLPNTLLVPFGANLDDPGSAVKDLRGQERLTLLTVGVEWHRKGIDRAVEAAANLTARGMNVHLHVVGALPPDSTWRRPYVTYHGFLSKSVDGEAGALDRLYRDADVFLLPTRLEPFGIVFQEAAAHALPSVTSQVGGVPEIVVNMVTGITLPDDAAPSDYADAIAELAGDPLRYAAMSAAARDRYESTFTWSGVAARVVRYRRGRGPGGSRCCPRGLLLRPVAHAANRFGAVGADLRAQVSDSLSICSRTRFAAQCCGAPSVRGAPYLGVPVGGIARPGAGRHQ